MRLVVIGTSIGACLASGCRSRPAPPPPTEVSIPRADPPASAPTTASEAENAAARAATAKSDLIVCPEGAAQRGTAPPDGAYAWCELPSGERHGPWMVWPGRGTPRKVARYERGKLHGTWTQWHTKSDALARVDTFVGGEAEGPTYRWHPNGQLAAQGAFRAGAPVGRFRAWDPDGRIIHDVVVAPSGDVTTVSWDEEERVEQVWRGGKRTGSRTSWYPNGQKASEEELVDGSPHGAYASWYPNGQKKSEGQANHGVSVSSKRWTETGVLEVPMCAHGPCDETPGP